MSRLFEKLNEKLAPSPAASASSDFSVSCYLPEQRRLLLALAHQAILSKLELMPPPEKPREEKWLEEARGVFSTLYLRGHLRGCIGYALPVAPLFRAVSETALAAAFNDPRFAPVDNDEARELEVSLSVLSPLRPIRAEEVVVGLHGLLISDGSRRGLLLPQVPVENGWDRRTFLEQTCRKANLPQDAWRHVAIESFTAEVFGDSNLNAR